LSVGAASPSGRAGSRSHRFDGSDTATWCGSRRSEDDLEDFLLERSEAFWKMIERARKGKSVGIDEVRKRLKI